MKNINNHPENLAPRGKIVVYKRAYATVDWSTWYQPVIVVLEIPANTQRLRARHVSRYGKHRAAQAKVLRIETCKGRRLPNSTTANSNYDNSFIYTVGKIARPQKKFDNDLVGSCGSGIHFFLYRKSAVKYAF